MTKAINRMNSNIKYEEYFFTYDIENMDKPRIKTMIYNDGHVNFTVPLHFIGHTPANLEVMLGAALKNTINPDCNRITKYIDENIIANTNSIGRDKEISIFKMNNGIVDCDDASYIKKIKRCKRTIASTFPGLKKYIPSVDIRVRKHMALDVYSVASLYPRARLIYLDEDLLKDDVPNDVLCFILYHEIGVIKSWDRKKDRFRDNFIENYIRSWRTYRNNIHWMKEKGWRFKYGDRESEFWIDRPYTNNDTGRDEDTDR